MTGKVHRGMLCGLGVRLAQALAPVRPVWADAITRVKGVVMDNHDKPLAKVTLYFEAVEIKKRVGPLRTGKDGAFVIATLDMSVAKKWKLIPQLEGYKTVKVSFEIIDSEENERGKGDVIMSSKQEFPDLTFALVGTEGRNIVNFVMAKEAEFNAAVADERKKKKALALPPDSDSVYYNRGKAYEQSGNDAKALETLEKAATLNTTKPEPLMQMAAIYEKQRDAAQTPPDKSAAAAKAGAVYDRIKAIDPKNAAILFFNVGAKAKNENRMKEAVQAFQKSVEIDPTYASGHRELGYALIGTQDFAGAIKQFQEYLKLTPAAPDAKDIQKTIAAIK